VKEMWLVRSSSVLSRAVGSDVLLTAPGREDVVRLAGTAGAVWELMENPQTMSSLVSALNRRYDAARETIAADVKRLVSEMLDQGWAEAVGDGDD
jgi:Coenzyme PQQ synthesis protein D (PqqD)